MTTRDAAVALLSKGVSTVAKRAKDRLDLVIRAPRAIVDGRESARAIGIAGESIVGIFPLDSSVDAEQELDIGLDAVLLPGLVDSHVHICEPGNTEWEGFATATAAAAAGGVTTLVDMPLDSVPTTINLDALEAKRSAAEGQCRVDVGFWGGVVPGNLPELGPLHQAGVFGFKCFLSDSGAAGFPPVSPAQMEEALSALLGLDALLLVHAEEADGAKNAPDVHGRHYRDFLDAHPRSIEDLAVRQVIDAVRSTGGRAHIVHLSSANSLPVIDAAKDDGLRITAETCPHYLSIAAEEIPDGATEFKCLPPIRGRSNLELLWAGLADGILDAVVSDHSPSTVAMKDLDSGDFGSAWGGISSLGLGLPVIWTEARSRGYSLADVVRWMAERPAQVAGVSRKGQIAVGFDADFCVFAPDQRSVVDSARLHLRHPVTPYVGRELDGVVVQTWLRGAPVDLQRPRGRLLARDGA